jgi:hypothetical protein
LTLQEFKAQQEAKKMNLKKAETRKHEEIKTKNIETVESQSQKVTSIATSVKTGDLYNVGAAKSENAELLGFQAGGDDYFEG